MACWRLVCRSDDFFEHGYGNQPFRVDSIYFRPVYRYLWSTTSIHITADGAANRLYSMFPDKRERYIPDYIMVGFEGESVIDRETLIQRMKLCFRTMKAMEPQF